MIGDRKPVETRGRVHAFFSPRNGVRRRSAREDDVRAQFNDVSAAAAYADAHGNWGVTSRYFASRLRAVLGSLAACPGGDLIDVGCGPGVFAGHVTDKRPGEFRITVLDQSPAMIRQAATLLPEADVRFLVASAEDTTCPTASFDVAVAMGVIEYCDAAAVLREMTRIVRPGGLLLVTMLNPLSPYRLVEWTVYWPLLRILGRMEGMLGRPPNADMERAVQASVRCRPAHFAGPWTGRARTWKTSSSTTGISSSHRSTGSFADGCAAGANTLKKPSVAARSDGWAPHTWWWRVAPTFRRRALLVANRHCHRPSKTPPNWTFGWILGLPVGQESQLRIPICHPHTTLAAKPLVRSDETRGCSHGRLLANHDHLARWETRSPQATRSLPS